MLSTPTFNVSKRIVISVAAMAVAALAVIAMKPASAAPAPYTLEEGSTITTGTPEFVLEDDCTGFIDTTSATSCGTWEEDVLGEVDISAKKTLSGSLNSVGSEIAATDIVVTLYDDDFGSCTFGIDDKDLDYVSNSGNYEVSDVIGVLDFKTCHDDFEEFIESQIDPQDTFSAEWIVS